MVSSQNYIVVSSNMSVSIYSLILKNMYYTFNSDKTIYIT